MFPTSVGCKPVPPPSRKISAVLNSLVDDDKSLPAVVLSSIRSSRAAAMRDATSLEFETIQKQIEYEIQHELWKLGNLK